MNQVIESTREQWTARKQAQQQEALARAEQGISLANYPAIIEGFISKGIPASAIEPRVNVFTFNAWKAKGRFVKKGEHGVKVVTWVTAQRRDAQEGAEDSSYRFARTTTVFHISQTEEAR